MHQSFIALKLYLNDKILTHDRKTATIKKITEHELWDQTNRTLSSDHLNIYLCNI